MESGCSGMYRGPGASPPVSAGEYGSVTPLSAAPGSSARAAETEKQVRLFIGCCHPTAE
ncbi:hypothetical protein [Brevibacillus thermoruber]|uniref:hypothetical protein n=1 Tax=Brevibacillus thermoruber TaxID=33942 RepID=UPI0012E0045D|nr:hypothetical protein [Brevibacillus thermoruber]